ncbi:pathogenesis-related protein 5 [Folsomia candida]|uniref:Thaumatin-like protein 1 n=1 Tax=Folsomia candida TaxID=158441 RepID=A0A226E7E3_FOLCA|nr:pathogenesis-related protein 5 [Folsomia candida]OXA53515.1 Thaumatin-like protein 1 [Folsomia candida]
MSIILTSFTLSTLILNTFAAHQINVINRCSETVWVGTFGDNQIPAGGGFKLNPGQRQSFSTIDGWTSGRVWGKTGCDSNGNNCVTGNSPPGGRTTLQPVTLAEFGFDKFMGLDFYDLSLVDGFNLPMAIQPFGVNLDQNCKLLRCQFNFNVCPNERNFRQFDSRGRMVACNSGCSAKREDKYCCTGPYYNNRDNCQPTEYSRLFKDQCPDSYSYAYDKKDADWACKGKSAGSSGYEITFCP